MEIIVFSSKNQSIHEVKDVVQLFENGLQAFHLRKPNFSKTQIEDYLNAIPEKYHNRIVIHNFHSLRKKFDLKGIHLSRELRKKKYTSNFKLWNLRLKLKKKSISKSISKMESLEKKSKPFDYLLLTPVFTSISQSGHSGHSGNFGEKNIAKHLNRSSSKVYALGGVKLSHIENCKNMGFYGIALLGTIWNNTLQPLEAFLEIQKKVNNLNN